MAEHRSLSFDNPAKRVPGVGPSLWSDTTAHHGKPDTRVTMRKGGLRVRRSGEHAKRKNRVTSR